MQSARLLTFLEERSRYSPDNFIGFIKIIGHYINYIQLCTYDASVTYLCKGIFCLNHFKTKLCLLYVNLIEGLMWAYAILIL